MEKKTMRANRNLAWALLWAAFALLALWACHIGPEDEKDAFALEVDSAWADCDSVLVVLQDADGEAVDTLFHDTLKSVDQLRKLDAEKYDGKAGALHIRGVKDGGLCFEQTRRFTSGASSVTVDTLRDPNVVPVEILVQDELALTLGQTPPNLIAAVKPAYADPALVWSVDGSGAVALEGLQGGKGNPAKVKPLKVGAAVVTVRSAKDTSVSARVAVRVTSTGGAAIDIVAPGDTILLFEKGEAESLSVTVPEAYRGETVRWSTGKPDVAEVDAKGRITPVKAGETSVKATLDPSGLSDEALVVVRKDVPVVTAESAPGAAVNAEIVYTVKVAQRFGSITLFQWDLDGDGRFEDSSRVDLPGDEVTLPAKKASYSREGSVTVRFRVRDSEGNEAEGRTTVEIGNQAPVVSGVRKDTTISVKDSIPMRAAVKDPDGKVAWVGWDYENDGQFDDSAEFSEAEVTFNRSHRFVEAGLYLVVLKAVDQNGKARIDTSRVRVELDPPVADAGADSALEAGKPFTLSLKGTDKFGPISKREYRCGSDTAFRAVSRQDTALTAPTQAGPYKCVVRVTDDDGLTGTDEVVFTVVLSSNAELVELALSAGSLAPTFRPNAVTYEGRVAFQDSLVTVTPKAKDGSSEILVNGKVVASGAASAPVRLQVGRNNWTGRSRDGEPAFTILVTAADGSQRTYVINMTREPNGEATLAKLEAPSLSLSPAFAPGALEYVDTVTQDVQTVTFKPTVASAGATLAFNDTAMVSGTFTGPRPLAFGENVFRFLVTAMDEKSTTLYTVRVVRLGRLIAFRKLGGGAALARDTIDLPVGSSRPLSAAGSSAYLFSQWSVLEGEAEFSDKGANPTTVTLKSGFARVQAAFNRAFRMTAAVAEGRGLVSPVDSLVDSGAVVVWRFRPANGYRILGVKANFKVGLPWTTDSVRATNEPEGGARADQHLNVHFMRQFPLRVDVGVGGTVNQASRPVDSGTVLSFTASPADGFRVDSIFLGTTLVPTSGLSPMGPGSVSPQNWQVTMSEARLVRVVFKKVYTLKVEVSGDGKASPTSIIADSGSTHTVTFQSGTGQILSGLTDNGASVLSSVAGDLTATSTLKLESIQANHALSAAFTLRKVQLTVVGLDVCVRSSQPCPDRFCLNPCFLTKDPADSVSFAVDYGTSWIMSTADSSGGVPFRRWNATPTTAPAATTNPDTVTVTSDVTYRALYQNIIICPRCVDGIDPIKTLSKTAAGSGDLEAREPEAPSTDGTSP